MDIIIKNRTAEIVNQIVGNRPVLHVFDYTEPLNYVHASLKKTKAQCVVCIDLPDNEKLEEAIATIEAYREENLVSIDAVYCFKTKKQLENEQTGTN